MNVLNVGPGQWFTPHFVYSNEYITASHFDPLVRDVQLLPGFIQSHEIQALQVFRGDLIREFLEVTTMPHVEWSTEIYPHNHSVTSESDLISWGKLVHCLKNRKSAFPFVHYDESRTGLLKDMGFPFTCNLLGVNMSYYKAHTRDIDVLFFGRSSERRLAFLKNFKERSFSFVWIEHGLHWRDMSSLLCRSKIVINLSADGNDNFEPRVLLALAAGCGVISEASLGLQLFLQSRPHISSHQLQVFHYNDIGEVLDLVHNTLLSSTEYPFDRTYDSNTTFLSILTKLASNMSQTHA